MCASSGLALSTPRRTIFLNRSSLATCQWTGTCRLGMPPRPSGETGSMARRVHRTTPRESGSPEATPSWNTSVSGVGRLPVDRIPARTGELSATARPRPAPPAMRERRVIPLEVGGMRSVLLTERSTGFAPGGPVRHGRRGIRRGFPCPVDAACCSSAVCGTAAPPVAGGGGSLERRAAPWTVWPAAQGDGLPLIEAEDGGGALARGLADVREIHPRHQLVPPGTAEKSINNGVRPKAGPVTAL
uniref:FunU9 n=1 Tax=Streptosporangium sp. KD35 TaxID=2162663 RepID=A0A2U9KD19_9ACTN|nr:FunU9 [Streptosporangium sp. KD35]